MWDEKYSLVKLNDDKLFKKRSEELEYLRKEFLKKMFDDIEEAELSVSEEEQNIYFVEGFKQGVKFLLSCLD